MGSILLLITMFSGAPGIGWGKPVPVNPGALRLGRFGMAIVSGAGPFSNIVIALLAALALRYGADALAAGSEWAIRFLYVLMLLNVSLCVFNLIPLPPLDGFGVAVGVLPWSLAAPLSRLAQYGPGLLMLVLLLPFMLPIDPLGFILGPPRAFLLDVLSRVAGVR